MKLKLDLEVGEGREEVGLEGGQLVTTQYQLLQSLIVRKQLDSTETLNNEIWNFVKLK